MAKEYQIPSENNSLTNIFENDSDTNSLNEIQKELARISPSYHSISLSSIPYIDSASSLSEEHDSKTSLTDTDIISSLHRKSIDNSSDDDLLFLEWDKERKMFQDYISSLRKEIRVLLQERAEHQQKASNDDQMKIDLLQKSSEEKDFIIEQLQTDNDLMKDKNRNLIKQISLIQSDAKSYIGIIDELKQKIADLTIDLQNHIIIKRRLEISINNLENDCKVIDNERIRLTNDSKDNQHQKQDLEKLLQKANVQIAEQGSTIEMLRSENVQVRSQLSTIQRRMFQEKQQILDYLRQIENDLIEKEQIKQRESSLREEYEQLKGSIHQDQQKIQELQKQCSQLLNQIDTQTNEKNQFQLEIKHLYTIFHLPIESHEQDHYLSLKPIENHFQDLINNEKLQRSDIEDKLRRNVETCSQLEEANRAWQQFHQTQLENFRTKLQNYLPIDKTFSFDDIAQLIINQLHSKSPLLSLEQVPQLSTSMTPIEEVPTHTITSVQSTPLLLNEHDDELRQLRESVSLLTNQCTQLDEANRAWQQYQQNQLEFFRTKLQDYVPFHENITFDALPQLIIDQLIEQQEEFDQKYEGLEKINKDLREESQTNLETIKQTHTNTIDELTRELLITKEELDKQIVNTNNEESLRKDILRNRLQDYFSIDFDSSFEEIVQQILEEIKKERARYQALEKINHDLKLESEKNLETIRQSYLNTIDELNQELLSVKELSLNSSQTNESPSLNSNLIDQHQSNSDEINRIYQEFQNILPISTDNSLEEIISYIKTLIDSNNSYKQNETKLTKDLEYVNQQLINVYNQCEQLQQYNKQLLSENQTLTDDDQMKQDYIVLQNQSIQLDNANRAWQQFFENQLDFIKNQFKDYIDFDQNSTFEQIIQTIVSELQQQNTELETAGDNTDVSDESSTGSQEVLNLQEEIKSLENQLKVHQSSLDLLKNNLQLTTDENEQLKKQNHEIQEKYDLLLKENENLTNQLDTAINPSTSNEDIHQLQTNISLLTNQCSQLEEANRAWQQFHNNQLELFREKLKNWISLDTNSNLEQISQEILNQLGSLQNQLSTYQYNETILAKNLEELNQKLLDVHKQCEEFREHNAQLILLKQQFEESDNQIKEQNEFRNKLQDYFHLEENLTFDQIPQMIVDQMAKQREEFNQRYQALEKANHDLRIESETKLTSIHESYLDTIKELKQELRTLKEKYQELEIMNKELALENENLNDRSLVLGHQSSIETQLAEQDIRSSLTIDQSTQYKPVEQNHIATETLPLVYQHIHTQIDPIHTTHQQNQTESLWSHSDEDNQLIHNEQLNEYIDEISSLPLNELNKKLKKECDYVLSKQHIQIPNFDLPHLALLTIYFLSNQHLVDEAKQLYNETVIRALKEEYELINNEKNDLMQEQIIRNQLIEHQTQTDNDDEQQEKVVQINNKLKRVLHTVKEKINRIINEKPELFSQVTDDTIDRLDQMIFVIENQTKQNESRDIEELQQSLLEKEKECGLLEERINQVENELRKTLDDQTSLATKATTLEEERNALVEQEIQQLKEEIVQLQQRDIPSDEDIQSWKQQLDELNKQKQELEEQLNEYKKQVDDLIQERTSISAKETKDNETQADDSQREKLIQINNKLKRILQTFKDKISRIVSERPDLFDGVGEETSERLDHLISTVENQAIQIDISQAERNEIEKELRNQIRELESSLEQSQNEQQQKLEELSQKENEQTLLNQRLNEAELELRRISDDHTFIMNKYASVVKERDARLEHQQELSELKQSADNHHVETQTDEDIQQLREIIEQQSEEIEDLNTKYTTLSSQLESQAEVIHQKNQRENELENLLQERAHLLEEIPNKTSTPVETTDNESQTEDRQHDKLVQINNKLKRVLQTFKDKISRIATERPDLFDGIGEETSERLDHLIATIQQQATQINTLQREHNEAEEKYLRQIKEIQSSFDACQYELDNERRMKMERLVSTASLSSSPPPSTEDTSSALIEDYQKQIKQLQQNLSQKDDERALLREHLNEVELELRKTIENQTSILAKYESVVAERDALIEQQNLQISKSEREIKQLKQVPAMQPIHVPTNEDIQSLHDLIEQQTQQIQDLNETNSNLLSQIESQNEYHRQKKEIDEQVKDYEKQIESLLQERTNLLEEVQKLKLVTKETKDNETQADDPQREKLIQVNNKLKRILQTFKDKISRIVSERPDLFDGVGEETSERLDHLISTIENQAIQMSVLQAERHQTEEQLRNEIIQLQNSLEQCQNENRDKIEQLTKSLEDYQQQIQQLQETLSEKENEQTLLNQRLNESELELRRISDDHSSIMSKHASIVEERDASVAQKKLNSDEYQHEIEQLKKELNKLKQLPDYQHVEIQTEEDITALQEMLEKQSEQLKDLNEKNITLVSQLKSQADLIREKQQTEERLTEIENQNRSLAEERVKLLENVETTSSSTLQTTDDEREQLIEKNNNLEHILQTLKDKLQRVVTERPDLFNRIGEETNERIEHVINTLENQAEEINTLREEYNKIQQQYESDKRQLQSSLEQSQDEQQQKLEELSSSIEDYQQQIRQLYEKLSEKENEQTLLSQRLNEAEPQFQRTSDDHDSTMSRYTSVDEERDELVEEPRLQSEENQHEIEQLKKELNELKKLPEYRQIETQTDEDINALHELIQQQSQQINDLNTRYTDLSSQLGSQEELIQQKTQIEERLAESENEIRGLTEERTKLLGEIEKKAVAENENRTDDAEREQLVEEKNNLEHILQTLKDKFDRAVTNKPNLFDGIGEETSERLEHVIRTVENQATRINQLQAERDLVEEQLRVEIKQLESTLQTSQTDLENERRDKIEQLLPQSANYQRQIEQLQHDLSHKDEEQTILRARLNELEHDLKKTSDECSLAMTKYELLTQEHHTLVAQQTLHTTEHQSEIEQLKNELNELKQTPDHQHREIQTDEDMKAWNDMIEQIKNLNEKNTTLSSQLEFHTDLLKEKNQFEERLVESENHIRNLIDERTKLLEDIQKNISPSIQTIDNESQTDDDEHEKFLEEKNNLEHVLQTLKDKLQRAATNKPNLFDGISEETSERLDHLISTAENQSTEIDKLQIEHDQIEKQLRDEITKLQSSLETNRNEFENERREKMEQSASLFQNYEKQIEEFQQSLSQKDDGLTSLNQRVNEIESELKKALDDCVSTTATYESLIKERETEYQREIEQLNKAISELKQLPDYQHVEIQTDEDINALHELIQQQSQQINDLNARYTDLSSQLDSQEELIQQKTQIEERLAESENEIRGLTEERTKLLDEIEKKTLPEIETRDIGNQTDDDEHEQLVEKKNNLEHILQTLKDKFDRVATDKPDLFTGISEETSERVDHLIRAVENQATQLNQLQTERDQVEEQFQNEVKELQNSLESYRYQIENERPTKTEELVCASPAEDTSSSIIEEYRKEIEQLQQNLSQKVEDQNLLEKRLNEVEDELRKITEDHTSMVTNYEGLIKERDDLNERNTNLSSQLDTQKKAIEEKLNERENQIRNLTEERTQLLEEIKAKTISDVQITENSIQTDDDEHEKLLEVNNSLKSTLETIEDKLDQLMKARPDLFSNTDNTTNERLDHLISSIERQTLQLTDLQNSFDNYRQQTNEYISSLSPATNENETQTTDLPTTENQNLVRTNTQITESDDSESNAWFDASPDTTDKEEIEHQQSRDIDIQTEIDSTTLTKLEDLKKQIHQILFNFPTLVSISTDNPFENLNQIESLIKNLQNDIKQIQSSFDTYRHEIENERVNKMQEFQPNNVYTQTLGLSIFEEHEKQIKNFQDNELIYQREIERLTEERNQARELLSRCKEENQLKQQSNSLKNGHDLNSNSIDLVGEGEMKQIKSVPKKINAEIQTINNLESLSPSPASDQSISRRIFEQEMLAWSKESEQLKRFVKQIQVENNKLKDIIKKFELMVNDYMHENDRLKHENQHLSWINYSPKQKNQSNTNDNDDEICYLTVKCLTYEVAQRVANGNQNEQLSILKNQSEQDLKLQSTDNDRQMKSIRVQNERLKNQLETYTIQFKHIQHEMNIKLQEVSILKDDVQRLRMNEIQSRLEIDRLKTELEDDQSKIQQLEQELSNLKLKQTNKDTTSINNLRELLELKERELNALKEKLDYTKQTHKIELQEAMKNNQFSLENVKRFEQMNLSHEEKRRELETRLGKFCNLTRSLINHQHLFIENPVISIEELKKLIVETERQEKITNSLSPIRDCLSLLEAQMKDLHHSIIENHARRSKRWKYKLGFECLSCESRWEVTHDIRDLQEACLDPSRFLESSIVEPMAGCSCPIMIDFAESDIRLCLDDIINEVVMTTTVK